jgi:hypothetical protein
MSSLLTLFHGRADKPSGPKPYRRRSRLSCEVDRMKRPRDKAPQDRWKVAEIAEVQRETRELLVAVERDEKGGVDAKLGAIFTGITNLADDPTPLGQLRRYVFCMSGLVHHQRFGGLKDSQVRRLSEIAFTILKTQGITAQSSRLGFLYGDLHLVLSQIYRTSGRLWEAAWAQQLARRLSKSAAGRGRGFQAMAAAVRALRLAHGRVAELEYRSAEALAESAEAAVNAGLGRLKTLRLMGRHAEVRELASALGARADMAEEQRTELAWEILCNQAQVDGDLGPLVRAVRRGEPHHTADYLLEAFYWTRAVSSTQWLEALPKVKTMARSPGLKPQRHGHFFRFAQALEDAYDAEIPFELRLHRLGDLLAEARELISVDKEMLAWAAATRWLARAHSFSLATLTMAEYHGLGRKLTDGRLADPLGVLDDLASKAWYLAPHDEAG